MSEYTDNLRTLILEHEQAVQTYEQRLDYIGEIANRDELQSLLVRTQIEFVMLNAKSIKLDKERELEHAIRMEKYEAMPPGPISLPVPRASVDLGSTVAPLMNYMSDLDMNGGDYADWFCAGFGVGAVKHFQSQGKEALLNTLKSNPYIHSESLSLPEGRMEQFVDDFLAYVPSPEQENG